MNETVKQKILQRIRGGESRRGGCFTNHSGVMLREYYVEASGGHRYGYGRVSPAYGAPLGKQGGTAILSSLCSGLFYFLWEF